MGEDWHLIVSASGIRGVFDPVESRGFFYNLGYLAGRDLGRDIALGRDSRPTGRAISSALLDGLSASGVSPRYVGLCTVPVMARSVRKGYVLASMMVTASHNPPEWNGLKIFSGDGLAITEDALKGLVERAQGSSSEPGGLGPATQYRAPAGVPGNGEGTALLDVYVEDMLALAHSLGVHDCALKVIVDAGNGPSALIAPRILEDIGCKVEVLNAELDGAFRRPIEPLPENLTDLCKKVQRSGADLGVGFDCDGDRAVFVAEDGEVLRDDYTLAFAVDYYLSISARPVVVNRATSLLLDGICRDRGVPLIRAGVGERVIASKMLEVGAEIGGEGSSGGVILSSFGLTRDGTLALVLLCALLLRERKGLSDLVDRYPRFYVRKAKLQCDPESIQPALSRVKTLAESIGVVDVSDDIRVSGDGWWVLVRPSRTEPVIRVISEDRSEDRAESRMRSLVEEVQRGL